MDRKSLIAVALCVLFLVFYPQVLKLAGWDKYMNPGPAPRNAVTPGPSDSVPVSGTRFDSAGSAGTPLAELSTPATGATVPPPAGGERDLASSRASATPVLGS
ncbi:MAG: hypothetical protein ABIS67_15590, partial [Candidatus Eisenbacteria bacterium]